MLAEEMAAAAERGTRAEQVMQVEKSCSRCTPIRIWIPNQSSSASGVDHFILKLHWNLFVPSITT